MKAGSSAFEATASERNSRPTRLRASVVVDGIFALPLELREKGTPRASYALYLLGSCAARGMYVSPLPAEILPSQVGGRKRAEGPPEEPDVAVLDETARQLLWEDPQRCGRISFGEDPGTAHRTEVELRGEQLVLFEETLQRGQPLKLYLQRDLHPTEKEAATTRKAKPEQLQPVEPLLFSAIWHLNDEQDDESGQALRLLLTPDQALPYTVGDFYLKLALRFDLGLLRELRRSFPINFSELFLQEIVKKPTKETVLDDFERLLEEDFAAGEGGANTEAIKERVGTVVQSLMAVTHNIKDFGGITLTAQDQLYNFAFTALSDRLYCWANARGRLELERAGLRTASGSVAEERYLIAAETQGIVLDELWVQLSKEAFEQQRLPTAKRLFKQAIHRRPHDTRLKLDFVHQLLLAEQWTDAENGLKYLIAQGDDNVPELVQLLALTVMEQLRGREAFAILRHAEDSFGYNCQRSLLKLIISRKNVDTPNLATYCLARFRRAVWLKLNEPNPDPFFYSFSSPQVPERQVAFDTEERKFILTTAEECAEKGFFRVTAALLSLLESPQELLCVELESRISCALSARNEALEKLNAVLLLDPGNPRALVDGLILLVTSSLAELPLTSEMAGLVALGFDRLDRRSRWRFLSSIGQLLLAKGEWEAAEGYLSIAMSFFPYSIHFHLQLSQLRTAQKDFTGAIKALEAAHSLDPLDAQVLQQLIVAHIVGERVSLTPKVLRRLLSLPFDSDVDYPRLQSLLELENMHREVEELKKFCEKNY